MDEKKIESLQQVLKDLLLRIRFLEKESSRGFMNLYATEIPMSYEQLINKIEDLKL